MDIVERLRRTELHHVWDDLEGKMVGKMFSANPDGPEAADEIERLRRANKVQSCTIRSLQYSKSKIVYETHIAVKTLDSEKEANAILTDEIERLREALRLERQLKDDALRAFNEAQVALKEGE